MKFNNFVDFDRYGEALWQEEKMEELVDLYSEADKVLPEPIYKNQYFLIKSTLASLYRSLGQTEKFYNICQNLIDNGYACGNWMVQALEKIENKNSSELIQKNDFLLEKLQDQSEMKYEVHLPKDYSESHDYPVFFALHGDGADSNIHTFSQYWTPEAFVEKGIILVYVQSSQVYCHKGYQWNKDLERAKADLLKCFHEVSNQYNIDKEAMMVGGFSGGAMIATYFTLENTLDFKGFIGLCPGSVRDYYKDEKLKEASRKNIKAFIIEGGLDTEASVNEMLERFQAHGLDYQYHLIDKMGHMCPPDLGDYLKKALTYMMS